MEEESTVQQLEKAIVDHYNSLKNLSPNHYYLKMVRVEENKSGEPFIREFTSLFDEYYNDRTMKQKYGAYISDLEQAISFAKEQKSHYSWDPMDGSNSP